MCCVLRFECQPIYGDVLEYDCGRVPPPMVRAGGVHVVIMRVTGLLLTSEGDACLVGCSEFSDFYDGAGTPAHSVLKSFRGVCVMDSLARVAAALSQVARKRDRSLLGVHYNVPDEPVGCLDVWGVHDDAVLFSRWQNGDSAGRPKVR